MTAPGRSARPRYFLTPEGRPIRPSKLAAALREIRKAPDRDYPGWNWFPTPGHFILREVLRGIHDMINLRAQKGTA